MQSRTSYFNGTLFRKNLTRFWPLWGMASFLGSLFPLAILLELMRDPDPSIAPLDFTAAYYEILIVLPVISLLYAVLCAMLVWSYLYNARSVGLMHTLPIRREGLFLTNFLSGMAMMLIPYAVVGGLCVLISLAYGCLEPVGLLVTVLGVLGESFFYFASATLAAFITSNLFALPALYFLLHFLAVLLNWLLSLFAGGFLFGLDVGYSGAAEWLSPTVYLIRRLDVDREWGEAVPQISYADAYTPKELTSVTLENGWLIGIYALVGAALLVLAYALYRRRRSESAGDVVAAGWMKPLFRYGVAALAALVGGLLLYTLFWESFQRGILYDALPMAVCMAVAGIIGYYAASMLLAKSLRVFRKSWLGAALVAASCAAMCCVLHFDTLGISSRVPEISEVEEVQLYTADNHYTFYPGEEDALLEQVRQVHRVIAADKDYILQETNAGSWYSADMDASISSFHVTYTLSNGRVVERNYLVPLSRDRMAQPGTYDHLLDQLVNSSAMKAKRLHVGDERYAVKGGWLYLEQNGSSADLNSREAAAILEALGRDAAAGAWGTYDWFDSDRGGTYALSLELSFSCQTEWGSNSDWITIALRPGMENTVACLKDLGLVTDAGLTTYAELYPEDYGYEAEYDAAVLDERVPDDVEYPFAYEDPYDAPVIGGADGPTEVFVAGTITGAAA